MRILVPGKRHDLDERPAPVLVAGDKSPAGKRLKQPLHVALVVGQQFRFDAPRAVLQPARAIGQRPEAREQQPPERLHVGKHVVLEKPGFQRPRAWHRVVS